MHCGQGECAPGEELVIRPGKCCPECSINRMNCFYDDILREVSKEIHVSSRVNVSEGVTLSIVAEMIFLYECSFVLWLIFFVFFYGNIFHILLFNAYIARNRNSLKKSIFVFHCDVIFF